jgi:type 1 glutamine amidotransferase
MIPIKKIAIGLAGSVALLVIVSLAVISWFGAWGIVFPSHAYETEAPRIAADFGRDQKLRALVFSKTNSFRHHDGIAGARRRFDALAAERDWAVFYSENSALFDADHLARFDVVIFSNTTGDALSDAQDLAFAKWLEEGGGWVGIHSAGDDSHWEWTWYQETLIGSPFTAHIMGPQTQEARVVVENRDHPVTRGLPAEFQHSEEWYSWEASARKHGFDVLLSVDESSYEPFVRLLWSETDLRMQDHPIVWTRCVGRGRALYSAMGHWGEAYDNPPYATLLGNAVEWVAGGPGSGTACRDPDD